jgi:hypothetical protein
MYLNKVMAGLTLSLLFCSGVLVAAVSLSDFVYEDEVTFEDGMKALNSGDVETTISVWTSLAKQDEWPGRTEVQHQLGLHYYLGVKSFPQNYKKAFKWFSRAARQGDSDSQIYLGLMYETAQGVLIDYRFAYMWMNLGGDNGYESSIHMDRLIKKMVPADISRAKVMSKRCLLSKYTDCTDSFFDQFYSIFD